MLSSASQSKAAPYWAVTAGPNSHSPEPMLVPARTTPGPIRPTQSRQPALGGAGRLPIVQAGRYRAASARRSKISAARLGEADIQVLQGELTQPRQGINAMSGARKIAADRRR